MTKTTSAGPSSTAATRRVLPSGFEPADHLVDGRKPGSRGDADWNGGELLKGVVRLPPAEARDSRRGDTAGKGQVCKEDVRGSSRERGKRDSPGIRDLEAPSVERDGDRRRIGTLGAAPYDAGCHRTAGVVALENEARLRGRGRPVDPLSGFAKPSVRSRRAPPPRARGARSRRRGRSSPSTADRARPPGFRLCRARRGRPAVRPRARRFEPRRRRPAGGSRKRSRHLSASRHAGIVHGGLSSFRDDGTLVYAAASRSLSCSA